VQGIGLGVVCGAPTIPAHSWKTEESARHFSQNRWFADQDFKKGKYNSETGLTETGGLTGRSGVTGETQHHEGLTE
jgi:hypothetical protein